MRPAIEKAKTATESPLPRAYGTANRCHVVMQSGGGALIGGNGTLTDVTIDNAAAAYVSDSFSESRARPATRGTDLH